MRNQLTVRDINKTLLRDRPVVAKYLLNDIEYYGRIIRARTRAGILQGRLLGSLRWVAVYDVQESK